MEESLKQALEKLRERGYDGVADKIAEGFQRWDDGVWLRGSTLRERYLKSRVKIRLEIAFRFVGSGAISYRYGIDFQPAPGALNYQPWNENYKDICHADVDGQAAMLVDAVKFMNLPEGVRLILVPSEIWLQCLDGVNSGRRDALNLSFKSRFGVGVPGLLGENGELRTLYLLWGHVGGEGLGQREREMVQGRPEIVYAIACDEAEGVRDGSDTDDPETTLDRVIQILSGIRVWFVHDTVGLALDPGLGLKIESLKMLACPIELEAKARGDTHGEVWR